MDSRTGKVSWYRNRDGSIIGTDGDRILGIVNKVSDFPVEAYVVDSLALYSTPEAAQASLDESYAKYRTSGTTATIGKPLELSSMSLQDMRDFFSDIVSLIDTRLKLQSQSQSRPQSGGGNPPSTLPTTQPQEASTTEQSSTTPKESE